MNVSVRQHHVRQAHVPPPPSTAVKELGHTVDHDTFFDTLAITLADGVTADKVMAKARDEFQINLRKLDHNRIGISLDETTRGKDVQDLLAILSVGGRTLDAARFSSIFAEPKSLLGKSVHARTTDFLTNPIFNTFVVVGEGGDGGGVLIALGLGSGAGSPFSPPVAASTPRPRLCATASTSRTAICRWCTR